MAAVSVNTGIPRPDKSAFEVSPDQLKPLAMARRRWAEIDLPSDCRLMKQVSEEAPVFAEAMGFDSAEAFLTEYLGLDLDLVQRVVGWLDQEEPAEPVTLEQVLRSHGGDRRSVEAREAAMEQPVNHSLIYGTGNADYIRARLHRDHPEVAAALDRGEYRSARAAAIEAGIIKPVPTIRLVDDLSKVAAKLHQHLTAEQRKQLINLLSNDPSV
jgi:hypothetical protein